MDDPNAPRSQGSTLLEDPPSERPDRPVPSPVRRPPVYRPVVRIRRYPQPPALWRHFLLLCLRPEQWPDAARYPALVTFRLVALAIVLVSVAVGIRTGLAFLSTARAYAASYDRYHPAFVYENDTLRVEPAPGKELPHFTWQALNKQPVSLVVDPAGEETALNTTDGLVVGPRKVSMRTSSGDLSIPFAPFLATLMEPDQKSLRIDSAGLNYLLDHHGWDLALGIGLATAALRLLTDTFWAAAVIILVIPLVVLGAPSLAMPRRVACRIAAAITIPLIVFGGALDVAGIDVGRVLPEDWPVVFWFFAAAALALWAGVLANRLYGRRPRRAG